MSSLSDQADAGVLLGGKLSDFEPKEVVQCRRNQDLFKIITKAATLLPSPTGFTKSRRVVFLSLTLAVFVLALIGPSGRSANGSENQPPPMVMLPAEDDTKYVGSDACKQCHEDQYHSYKFAARRDCDRRHE